MAAISRILDSTTADHLSSKGTPFNLRVEQDYVHQSTVEKQHPMTRPNENENENEYGTTTPDWGSPPSSPRSPPPRPTRQPAVAIRLTDSARREVLMTLPTVPAQPSISDVLKEEFHQVPGHTYQEKLNELSNCQCCDRHNRNKPHIYQPWTDTVCDGQQRWHDCGCKCRQLARLICRQYPAVYVCANDEPPPTTDQLAGMIFDENHAA